jgi:protease-4
MRRLFTFALLSMLILAGIAIALSVTRPGVPERSVLVVDLAGGLAEAPPLDMIDRLRAEGPALPTLLLVLEMAAADSRIEAVLLHVRALDIGYARLQELRDGIVRLRASGKPVVALLDIASFNATRELYLASAADRVFVVPGFLGPFAGVAGQYLQLGGLFERMGITWEYERVGEYKSAVETFAAREMSAPARAMMDAIVDGIFAQIVAGVSEGRNQSPQAVRASIDEAPGTAQEYVAAGLADGIATRQEVLETAELGDLEEIAAGDYHARTDPRSVGLRTGPRIALIFGDGPIVPHDGRAVGAAFAADRIVEALETAADDEEIRAIVLRVNSGGGSALASDQMWHAVRRARERKPVVVSMGEAAASGGYFVASAADAIVAEPSTLTGSIGVFFLRPELSKLLERWEIGTETIARGRHASVSAGTDPFTPEQRDRTGRYVRSIYRDFLERVAEGRGLPTERVDALGRGRVWLGEEALQHGLVDELGGLATAVARAKREANLPEDTDPARVVLPGPRSPAEQIQSLLRGDMVGWARTALLPVRVPDVLQWIGPLSRGEIAYLPPHWIEIH